MPLVDVSSVLLDADFGEPLCVFRRTQTAKRNGRALVSCEPVCPQPYGVVQPGRLAPMLRPPEYESSGQAITVYSKTRLSGPSDGALPDIVKWNGNSYVVRYSADFGHYGAGYYVAECGLMDPVVSSNDSED